jgi:hypothetical protein
MTPKSRRLMRVLIDFDIIVEWLTTGEKGTGSYECVEGIPPGAKVVGQHYDAVRNSMMIVVEHDDFEAVPLGEEIPILVPLLTWKDASSEVWEDTIAELGAFVAPYELYFTDGVVTHNCRCWITPVVQ